MKLAALITAVLLTPISVTTVSASTAVDTMFESYRQQGATQFNSEAGRQLWNQAFTSSEDNQLRRCTSCHTDDPRRAGKHAKTGKPIDPLAPSVNAKRLTSEKEMRKWFSRNCKWTLGRECTAQEQGDVLMYLKDL
jgi:hypothetical protein